VTQGDFAPKPAAQQEWLVTNGSSEGAFPIAAVALSPLQL